MNIKTLLCAGLALFAGFSSEAAKPGDAEAAAGYGYTVGRFRNEDVVISRRLAAEGRCAVRAVAVNPIDVGALSPSDLALKFEIRVTRNDGKTGKDSLRFFQNGWVEIYNSNGGKLFRAESPVQRGVFAQDRDAGRWMRAFYPLDTLDVKGGKLDSVFLFDYNDIPKQAEHTGVFMEVRNVRIVSKKPVAGATSDVESTEDEATVGVETPDPKVQAALARKTAVKLAAKPRTICNPMNLDYMIQPRWQKKDGKWSEPFIECGDPCVVVYKGEFWLFASHCGGYWVSKDLADWEFIQVDLEKPVQEEFKRYAPGTCVIGDTLYICHSESGAILKTVNPRDPAAWEYVGKPDGWQDPAMFYDDPAEGGDGYVYVYSGLSHRNPIWVVKLDPKDGMKKVGGTYACAAPDKNNRGYEVAGDDNLVYRDNDTQEGPWVVKHNGKYYLSCAVPGTGYASYADNCYVADSPVGPFQFCEQSPVTSKISGFTRGAGHSTQFKDLKGRWWKVSTTRVRGVNRRLLLTPGLIDPEGRFFSDTAWCDYPFYRPHASADPINAKGPGWNLLSYGKRATASSNPDAACQAFDEDIASCWSAETGDVGEWLQVDLGRLYGVWSVQVNFDDQKCTVGGRDPKFSNKYVVEFSQDGKTWSTLVDRSGSTVNRQHEYFEFADKVGVRHLRIVNKGPVPGNGRFAVNGLRVFGEGGCAAPAMVARDSVRFDRREGNGRSAVIEWAPVKGAQGYFVRYGVAPDRLYSHYQVIGDSFLAMNCLNRGVDYYFTVDAYNEGGATCGGWTVKIPDTEGRVEGWADEGYNPAFEKRVAGTVVHEAEKAKCVGKGVFTRYDARGSKAYIVQGLGPKGTYAEFAGVEGAEGATLRMCYAAFAPAKVSVSINGASASTIELPKTRGWADFNVFDAPVAGAKSANAVRIEGLGDAFLLDWIQLLPAK